MTAFVCLYLTRDLFPPSPPSYSVTCMLLLIVNSMLTATAHEKWPRRWNVQRTVSSQHFHARLEQCSSRHRFV